MFDTKYNIEDGRFEQASGDTMNYYGSNNFHGSFSIQTPDNIEITGSTIRLKSLASDVNIGDYNITIDVNDGYEQSYTSLGTSTLQFSTNDDWNNGYYSFSRNSSTMNVSSTDGTQSYFYMSPFNFSLTFSDSVNELNSSLFLGGNISSFQCGDLTFSLNASADGAKFSDVRTTTKGIEYDRSNYWTGFTNSSLTNKEYVDLHQLRSFTVSTLPSASIAGRMIYVSDESGGSVVAFSDGTNWRRMTDRNIVS